MFRTVSQLSGFFQIISHFPDGFTTAPIFPDHFPFSGQFHNCPEFSRSFSIFQMVSKLSRFFQIISHFPDSFTTVRIFPDHFPFSGWFQNSPGFSRSFPIFRMVSKLCILPSNILYYNSRTLNTHVVRGKHMLCMFFARNGSARFVRKVFARKMLLSGKFWVLAPLMLLGHF